MQDSWESNAALAAIWLSGTLASVLLGRYNRQPIMSAVLGIVLGPLGFFLVLMSSPRCPFCQNALPLGAKVCGSCTRDLPPP